MRPQNRPEVIAVRSRRAHVVATQLHTLVLHCFARLGRIVFLVLVVFLLKDTIWWVRPSGQFLANNIMLAAHQAKHHSLEVLQSLTSTLHYRPNNHTHSSAKYPCFHTIDAARIFHEVLHACLSAVWAVLHRGSASWFVLYSSFCWPRRRIPQNPPPLWCCANKHHHWMRPALKGLSGRKTISCMVTHGCAHRARTVAHACYSDLCTVAHTYTTLVRTAITSGLPQKHAWVRHLLNDTVVGDELKYPHCCGIH